MKNFRIFIGILAMSILLNGCILSTSPGQNVTMTPNDTMVFEVDAFPMNGTQWLVDDELVSGETGQSFTYLPAEQLVPVDTHTVEVRIGEESYVWTVEVSYGSLNTIAILPLFPWLQLTDEVLQFSATGMFEHGELDITILGAWSSSDETVATISNDVENSGLASFDSVGKTEVALELDSFSATTMLTVTDKTLKSIEITPSNPSIPLGNSEQFMATGYLLDSETWETQDITDQVLWSSQSPLVATINSTGLAESASVGLTMIFAEVAGKSTYSELNVEEAELISISINPEERTVAAGKSTNFSVYGEYTNNPRLRISSGVEWTSSNNEVASINDTGHVVTYMESTAPITITAKFEGKSITASLMVTAVELNQIIIKPINPSIPLGMSQNFTATGTYSDGTISDITESANWNSSMEDVATISDMGVASSVNPGATEITAEFDGISGKTKLIVTEAEVTSIILTVTNDIPSTPLGRDKQICAIGSFTDTLDRDITELVTWNSSEEGVATISNETGQKGLLTPVSVGDTEISATLGDQSGSCMFTATDAVVITLQIEPVRPVITTNETEQFSANGYMSDGTSKEDLDNVTWSSSDPTIATIDNTGVVTPMAVGITYITAVKDEASITTELEVIPGT